jgi:Calx-beta domain
VLVNGDRLPEPGETFVVNLSSPTNATIADGQGVGAIVDDAPRISISDVTRREGRKNTTSFVFTVTLSAACDEPVTMSYRTVDGAATTSDNDYVARTGTLTFAPGETAKTITIDSQGRQQAGGQRDVLCGLVRQQQQCSVHQEPRRRHDPERRLRA